MLHCLGLMQYYGLGVLVPESWYLDTSIVWYCRKFYQFLCYAIIEYFSYGLSHGGTKHQDLLLVVLSYSMLRLVE